MEKISTLESKLSAQEDNSSKQRAVGATEWEKLGCVHCFQLAAYRSSINGYGQQPALVDTGNRNETARAVILPEVRENVNSNPCHDF